jgi:hypothetical protein
MTVITAIKFQAGPRFDMESHEAQFWDQYFFLLYINDLPKIINKTSAPIIFADDTSIFARSNLIDFNKNIRIVFETLNK